MKVHQMKQCCFHSLEASPSNSMESMRASTRSNWRTILICPVSSYLFWTWSLPSPFFLISHFLKQITQWGNLRWFASIWNRRTAVSSDSFRWRIWRKHYSSSFILQTQKDQICQKSSIIMDVTTPHANFQKILNHYCKKRKINNWSIINQFLINRSIIP